MEKQLEQYYVARMEMFSSKGWKDFIEDVVAMQAAKNDIHNLATIEQLHIAKGEVNIMEWVIAIEDISRKAYDILLEDEE